MVGGPRACPVGDIMEQVETAYEVKLEAFNGPLDLLLHLIRKHEINIYDIPIALITRQYLEYLQIMKELNLSFAGDFLVMASTLVHIKSRTLLPQEPGPEPGDEEGEDPRSELVRRLVEYQQFKEVAGRLSEQERLWRQVYQREPEPSPPIREVFSEDVQVFDLLSALQEILAQTTMSPGLEFTPDTLTVQDRINSVIERLEETPALTFAALFEGETDRLTVIVTFLALLELVRMKLVRLTQVSFGGPIRITRTFLAWHSEEHPEGNGASPRIMNNDDHNGGFDGNGIL